MPRLRQEQGPLVARLTRLNALVRGRRLAPEAPSRSRSFTRSSTTDPTTPPAPPDATPSPLTPRVFCACVGQRPIPVTEIPLRAWLDRLAAARDWLRSSCALPDTQVTIGEQTHRLARPEHGCDRHQLARPGQASSATEERAAVALDLADQLTAIVAAVETSLAARGQVRVKRWSAGCGRRRRRS